MRQVLLNFDIEELMAENKKLKTEIISPIPLDDLQHILKAIEDNREKIFPKREKDEYRRNNQRRFHGCLPLEFIGSGSFGLVYGYKEYAIKVNKRVYPSESEIKNQMNDKNVLRKLNHVSCLPKLYAIIEDDIIIMERIRGKTVEDYFWEGGYKNNPLEKLAFESIRDDIYEIVSCGFTPFDVHENNVMIDYQTGKFRIIDTGYFREEHTCEFSDIEDNSGYGQAISYIDSWESRYKRKTKLAENKDVKLDARIHIR